MRGPRTARSLYPTPEDQKPRPRWSNPRASEIAPARSKRHDPLYGSETKPAPLHAAEGSQSHNPAVPGVPSVLLGPQTQGPTPRTQGPFSACMDPGLAKDYLINSASPRMPTCSNGARYLASLTKYHTGIILIIEMFGVVCVLWSFCICCALPKGLPFVKIGEDTPVPCARSVLPPVEHTS